MNDLVQGLTWLEQDDEVLSTSMLPWPSRSSDKDTQQANGCPSQLSGRCTRQRHVSTDDIQVEVGEKDHQRTRHAPHIGRLFPKHRINTNTVAATGVRYNTGVIHVSWTSGSTCSVFHDNLLRSRNPVKENTWSRGEHCCDIRWQNFLLALNAASVLAHLLILRVQTYLKREMQRGLGQLPTQVIADGGAYRFGEVHNTFYCLPNDLVERRLHLVEHSERVTLPEEKRSGHGRHNLLLNWCSVTSSTHSRHGF